MRIWTLDKGNTRTKVIVFEKLAKTDSIDQGNIAGITTLGGESQLFRWDRVNIVGDELPVVYSDVTDGIGHEGWLKLTTENSPLEIHYSTKETLGTDRIAAAIAASTEYHGRTLIVDAGTFITCDIVDSQGFHGGAIMAGLDGLVYLSERASGLKNYALSAANALREGQRIDYPGNSTLNCLINGYYHQTVKAIDDMAADTDNIVFTGGDGGFLSGYFNAPNDPVLVNKGLLLFYLQTGE